VRLLGGSRRSAFARRVRPRSTMHVSEPFRRTAQHGRCSPSPALPTQRRARIAATRHMMSTVLPRVRRAPACGARLEARGCESWWTLKCGSPASRTQRSNFDLVAAISQLFNLCLRRSSIARRPLLADIALHRSAPTCNRTEAPSRSTYTHNGSLGQAREEGAAHRRG
jgi:hypothetical protein